MEHSNFHSRLNDLERRVSTFRARGAAETTPADHMEMAEELNAAIEELHQAEEELKRQADELAELNAGRESERRRYLDLFEWAPVGYLVTDPRGMVREVNRAACDMLGSTAEILVGKPLSVRLKPATARQFYRLLNRTDCRTSHTW